MNIFPRAQSFRAGEPCIQIAWTERPDYWMNFEERKPGVTEAQQLRNVVASFERMKRENNLKYDVSVRIGLAETAARWSSPTPQGSATSLPKRRKSLLSLYFRDGFDGCQFVVSRKHPRGVNYLAIGRDGKWAWVSHLRFASKWDRWTAREVARWVRTNWRQKVTARSVSRA